MSRSMLCTPKTKGNVYSQGGLSADVVEQFLRQNNVGVHVENDSI
jgi:hypothetical protein